MKQLYENAHVSERVLCLGLSLKHNDQNNDYESLSELKALAESAGANVIDSFLQIKNEITPKYFIGSGMVEEISKLIIEKKIDTVIFDNELTAVQVRNLEKEFNCKVIGRTELILDIFALRAKSKTSKLQVELAQLEYIRPRLRRAWTHLSRIEGGIGLRGPGETQLETDKRLISKRISVIKHELKKHSIHIENSHKSRKGKNLVCLVGYTNAGKSTLLNSLTGDSIFAKDMLFSTLDSTTRKVFLEPDLNFLLSDTVGFIRKLPHLLVASFKSTLTEVLESCILVHVIDISREDVENQIESVNLVLEEIGALNKNIIHAFNKIDNLDSIVKKERFSSYSNPVFISAKTGKGLDSLRNKIKDILLSSH